MLYSPKRSLQLENKKIHSNVSSTWGKPMGLGFKKTEDWCIPHGGGGGGVTHEVRGAGCGYHRSTGGRVAHLLRL